MNRKLTQVDAILVADWLRDHKQEIGDGSIDSDTAVKLISKELGRDVAIETVLRLGSSFGVCFGAFSNGHSESGKISALVNSVAGLYREFEVPIPSELSKFLTEGPTGRDASVIGNEGNEVIPN